jgi:hypothetical protein
MRKYTRQALSSSTEKVNMLRWGFAIGLVPLATRAQESLPLKMVTAIKDATVMIVTHSEAVSRTG